MDKRPVLPELLGESESFIEARFKLSRAARVNRPVLILGERGTGKELAAARIHYLSSRWKGPYLTLNCAALSPNLVESELFGHEAGAFTGAARLSHGRFEAANGGSLFLDEISHLELKDQAKILRVVEYGSFQRLGSYKEQRVDVRLISASNVDLRLRAEQGNFLADLLDRLSFEVIVLPPLRDRQGDISRLAHLFAARMAAEMKMASSPIFTPEAMEALEAYHWPGNVRELKNVVERAVYHADGPSIEACQLEVTPPGLTQDGSIKEMRGIDDAPIHSSGAQPLAKFPFKANEFDTIMAKKAISLIEEAMLQARHSQKEAARLLGMSYHRFRALWKKYKDELENVKKY